MIGDLVAQHWNDALTLATAAAAGYQIKHYRAQSPDLNILEATEALYAEKPGRDVEPATDYEFKVRVENGGREATTISGATLTVDGETYDLERTEGSTEIPIGRDAPPNLPSKAHDEVRVPGNHVIHLKYRADGALRDNWDDEVEGTLQIRTAGGDTTKHTVTFQPRFE